MLFWGACKFNVCCGFFFSITASPPPLTGWPLSRRCKRISGIEGTSLASHAFKHYFNFNLSTSWSENSFLLFAFSNWNFDLTQACYMPRLLHPPWLPIFGWNVQVRSFPLHNFLFLSLQIIQNIPFCEDGRSLSWLRNFSLLHSPKILLRIIKLF